MVQATGPVDGNVGGSVIQFARPSKTPSSRNLAVLPQTFKDRTILAQVVYLKNEVYSVHLWRTEAGISAKVSGETPFKNST